MLQNFNPLLAENNNVCEVRLHIVKNFTIASSIRAKFYAGLKPTKNLVFRVSFKFLIDADVPVKKGRNIFSLRLTEIQSFGGGLQTGFSPDMVYASPSKSRAIFRNCVLHSCFIL